MDQIISILFGSSNVVCGLVLVLFTILLLAIIIRTSIGVQPQAKPEQVIKASFNYCMQITGIIILSLGLIPTVYSVLISVNLGVQWYASYIALFAIGGGIYLFFEHITNQIEQASRQIPFLLFLYTTRIISVAVMLLGVSTLIISLLFIEQTNGTWAIALTTMLYGIALLMLTMWWQNNSKISPTEIN